MKQSAAERTWIDYDWAVVRLVPRVHVEEFQNVGVIMHARVAEFLEARLELDPERLLRLWPDADIELIERYLTGFREICAGGEDGGPIGLLAISERFHWLTAKRSAGLQTSGLHSGRTQDLENELDLLFCQHMNVTGGT